MDVDGYRGGTLWMGVGVVGSVCVSVSVSSPGHFCGRVESELEFGLVLKLGLGTETEFALALA